MRRSERSPREPALLLGVTLLLLLLSGISPAERGTWFLETVPVMAAVPLLVLTFRRFPLTALAYRLIFVHACILMLGGHYTYAEVPLGFWVQDLFDFSRNHYDRLGHVAQGFIPAILAREVLLRKSPLRPGGWLFFTVTSFCLAFSAFYELIEWWAAVLGGSAADSFLGAQGDIWDSQWDMFFALVGAVAAQLSLRRLHDRELASIR